MIESEILGLKVEEAKIFLDKKNIKYEIIQYNIPKYRFNLSKVERVVAVIENEGSKKVYVAFEQEAVI